MKTIRIGILGAADIAFRRFLPALRRANEAEYIGVAIADYTEYGGEFSKGSYETSIKTKMEKAQKFVENYGGKVFQGYEDLLKSKEIDAVYIPLPPSLHYKWAKLALQYGKHVLTEKPSTISYNDTEELVNLASKKDLALSENYAFFFHKQVGIIEELIKEGKVGEVRLIRSSFGFPQRATSDFRYKKEMGGGALLDCGGYTLKIAQKFLGDKLQIATATLNRTTEFDVDLYGSVTIKNSKGQVAQLAFGMDNSYKCELEIWGSKACILAPRIFTPPANFEVQIEINGAEKEYVTVGKDDQFLHAIEYFVECIQKKETRIQASKSMLEQIELLEEVRNKAQN